MTCRRSGAVAARVVLSWVMLLTSGPAAPGQGRQVHGENSSFVGHGVAMAWGVLRGSSEQDTQVILRIALAGAEFAAVSLDGVDPFTQRRQELLGLQPLRKPLDVRTSRGTFADLPRREIHFHAANDLPAQRPSLTVYFLGLPDTTPEFASEAALQKYLEETLAKLLAGKGHTP
jgi:hypothetical protein